MIKVTRKFVYVLTGKDIRSYADLTYASISFLRYFHPDDWIVLLVDPVAMEALRETQHPLLDLVSQILAVETDQACSVMASRWLKTSMRRLVEGPFVFLDADTLPVGSLDKLFRCKCDFAAVSDYHSLNPRRAFPASLLPPHQAVGWSRPTRYFNSGVLYFEDTAAAKELGKAWHDAWNIWSSVNSHHDQPALAHALDMIQCKVRVLPQKWNAMFLERESSVLRARVLHAFSSVHGVSGSTGTTIFGEVQDLVSAGELTAESIRAILDRRYYWKNEDSVKRKVYCGHWTEAAALVLAKMYRRFGSRDFVGRQG